MDTRTETTEGSQRNASERQQFACAAQVCRRRVALCCVASSTCWPALQVWEGGRMWPASEVLRVSPCRHDKPTEQSQLLVCARANVR